MTSFLKICICSGTEYWPNPAQQQNNAVVFMLNGSKQKRYANPKGVGTLPMRLSKL
jgi:hypothetical protein